MTYLPLEAKTKRRVEVIAATVKTGRIAAMMLTVTLVSGVTCVGSGGAGETPRTADERGAARERKHRILVVAHRGAAGTRPENTLASFRRAIELGADVIELDVHVTADGVAVVIHDDTVDRTTNGHGRVREMTLAQIKQLDAGSWFSPEYAGERVPTLEEVVALTGRRVPLSIELKAPGAEDAAIAAVRNGCPRSFVSSFSEEFLRRVSVLDPMVKTDFLVGVDPMSDDQITALIARTRDMGAIMLSPSQGGATPQLVAMAHRAHLRVRTWTADSIADLQRGIDLAPDAITTDYPERLIDLLKRR
jgi:glycerophosphoryl diester phosphodiesterase